MVSSIVVLLLLSDRDCLFHFVCFKLSLSKLVLSVSISFSSSATFRAGTAGI